MVTRDKGNFILNAGANKIIDLLVKKLILSRAGWLTRIVVPYLLRIILHMPLPIIKNHW
ncbi:MAG: hypothetical protein WDO16_21835 [Bacteroidota bacterium]